MKLSEALSIIAAEYPEGCLEYYARMNPDPWSQAHEELEKHIRAPEEILDSKVDQFCSEIRGLEAAYKLLPKKHHVSPRPMVSGFYAGNVERANHRAAQVEQSCVDCMTKNNLVPLRTENGMVPICKACKNARLSGQQGAFRL